MDASSKSAGPWNDAAIGSRRQSVNRQDVNLRTIVDRVLDDLSESIARQRIVVTLDVPDEMPLHADETMVQSAVSHLARNAIATMPDGGELVLTGYAGEKEIELEIADSGPGLPPEGLTEKLLETSFDDPSIHRLSVAEHIAQLHGGRVTALNCPEGGAAFTLHFPVQESAKAAA